MLKSCKGDACMTPELVTTSALESVAIKNRQDSFMEHSLSWNLHMPLWRKRKTMTMAINQSYC